VVLHLHRVLWDATLGALKSHRPVLIDPALGIPLANGDVAQCRLRGVVVHSGTVQNGHYRALVSLPARVGPGLEWWLCDGAARFLVPEDEVLAEWVSVAAFLLLFEQL